MDRDSAFYSSICFLSVQIQRNNNDQKDEKESLILFIIDKRSFYPLLKEAHGAASYPPLALSLLAFLFILSKYNQTEMDKKHLAKCLLLRAGQYTLANLLNPYFME